VFLADLYGFEALFEVFLEQGLVEPEDPDICP
jgi:hypothetical protein